MKELVKEESESQFELKEFTIELLRKYGWCYLEKETPPVFEEYTSSFDHLFNFYSLFKRISSLFVMFHKKHKFYQVRLILTNKNGLYFIYNDEIFHKDKKFIKYPGNREEQNQDFNNIKFITKITDNIEDDIIKYNLISDSMMRNIIIDNIINQDKILK